MAPAIFYCTIAGLALVAFVAALTVAYIEFADGAREEECHGFTEPGATARG